MLFRLIGALRDNDKERSPDLLNLIRSNAPLDEIRLSLAQSQAADDAPHGLSKLQRRESHSRVRFMDLKRLTDLPLYRVPAQPWTSVTDDEFVSHLVSLYFTWQHSVLNWIDRDLFLRDMKSGNLDSRFCSPLLVNSILAVACVSLHTDYSSKPIPNLSERRADQILCKFYSDYPEVFALPDDPKSRGTHFFDEATELLMKEEGKVTLTTLQAMGDIYTR